MSTGTSNKMHHVFFSFSLSLSILCLSLVAALHEIIGWCVVFGAKNRLPNGFCLNVKRKAKKSFRSPENYILFGKIRSVGLYFCN